MAIRTYCKQLKSLNFIIRSMCSSGFGSGVGKGGGAGGAIRDAGGAFGKREAAREEEYFRKKQKEQFEQLKSHFHDEIERHEQLIKEHEKAIEANKKKIKELLHEKPHE